MIATKEEVEKFIRDSYKRAKSFEVVHVDARGINILDRGIGVPYKWVAAKLIRRYKVPTILFFVGSMEGNVWVYTKESLRRIGIRI